MLLNCGVGKDLESLLDCKEIQLVHPKGNQYWIFIGRTDAKAETPVLWPPDAKNWLIGKGPDAGKDWRQEEKGMTEDEMVKWHHWLYGHEFEQALGVDDGQGSLACYSPWGLKESDMTERLNWHWLMLYAVCVYMCVYVSVYGEDPLEGKMAIHSSILAWRIPLTEESGVAKNLTQLSN